MKRHSIFAIVLLLAVFTATGLRAQDAAKAAADADREAAEERYKQMKTDVANLIETQEVLRKELAGFVSELKRIREENASAGKNLATRDELNDLREKFQEKLNEADHRRESDNKKILEEMDKLGKLLQAGIPPKRPKIADKPEKIDKEDKSESGKTAAQDPYTHVVEKGENISVILAAYNKKFKEEHLKTVTLQQVLDANPGIVPEKLSVGQTINIPDPGK